MDDVLLYPFYKYSGTPVKYGYFTPKESYLCLYDPYLYGGTA